MAGSFCDSPLAKFADAWRTRATSLKAISFALIGVVNTTVDYGVFLLRRAALEQIAAALAFLAALNDWCGCSSPETLLLIAASTMSWLAAVTGSYIMNSSITFAVETGGNCAAALTRPSSSPLLLH